jgi:DNA primase catalytic core
VKKLSNIDGAKEYVREHSDLLKMIEDDVEDVEWTEESGDVHVCCSPFRDEQHPSFKVSGNRFKDWGGEQHSGDIFAWAQIWHGLSFVESIYHVAKKFELDLSPFQRDPTPEEMDRHRYIGINNIAADLVHQLLRETPQVRDDYLSRSGFSLDQIEPYKVGYCNDKDWLITQISQKVHLSNDDIDKLEFYRKDLFNNAIVYPIHDVYGDVLFFRCKQLSEGSNYIGVRSSHPLYDPAVIYGMHVAKKQIRKTGRLVVVEGQRDTIALVGGGVMGSEMSEEQADFLAGFKLKEIIFCYDSDHTGWTKTLDLVNKPVYKGEALVLVARPDFAGDQYIDKDPHDVWRNEGDQGVYKILSKAMLPIEYFASQRYQDPNNLTLTEQHRLLGDLQDFLVKTSGVQLDMATNFIAKMLNSTSESIKDHIAEVKAAYSQLFNLEAERTLIAHCMNNSASFSTAKSAGIINKSFTLSHYKRLYEACQIAYDKFGADYTAQAVLDEAMAKNPVPELPSIVGLIQDDNYKYTEPVSCEIVLDMWRRRTASEQATNLITASRDLAKPFAQVIDDHRKTLISTISSSRKQARTPHELAKEFYDEMKYREQLKGNLIIGHDISHALPSLSIALGGIQPHYTIVAGDSGAGKSLFGMNILNCLAIENKVPTMWIGQEMHSAENTFRLASIMRGINNTRLQSGNVGGQGQQKIIMDVVQELDSSGYHYAKAPDGHIDEILAAIDEYRWKFGIKVVIWDYIQLITASPSQSNWNREQIISHASGIIKNKVVQDMGLAAIIIAQMNRDKFSSGQHKIAGSYRLVQDCDNFVWIEKKSEKQIAEDGKKKGNRYLRLGKRRGGVSDIMIHANLDTETSSATLRLSERYTPSEFSQFYSKMAS